MAVVPLFLICDITMKVTMTVIPLQLLSLAALLGYLRLVEARKTKRHSEPLKVADCGKCIFISCYY